MSTDSQPKNKIVRALALGKREGRFLWASCLPEPSPGDWGALPRILVGEVALFRRVPASAGAWTFTVYVWMP